MTLKMIVEDGGGGWLTGHIPALPGCVSQGRTLEELVENIRDAAAGWLETEHRKAQATPDETIANERLELVSL